MRADSISRRAALRTLGIGGAVLCAGGSVRATAGAMPKGTDATHLLLFGGSPERPVRYRVGFTGGASRTTDAGGADVVERVTIDPEDVLSDGRDGGSYAVGSLVGGADAYRFDGGIEGFGISVTRERLDEVSVFLDGREVSPASLGQNAPATTPVTFLDCGTAVVAGESDSVWLDTTSIAPDGGIATDHFELGPAAGTTRFDLQGYHSGPFSLDVVSLVRSGATASGDRTVATNPFAGPWCLEQPGVTHHLVIFGGSPDAPASYELTTGATLRRTTDVSGTPAERATIDPDDELVGNVARGTVAGGADAYVFTGDLFAFDLSGDARVFLDGREVDPGTLGE